MSGNNGKAAKFDPRDRKSSKQAAERLQAGVMNTAAGMEQQPAVGSHPSVGELLAVGRKDMQLILMQFFTTLVFLREMLEQLQALEAKHKESAADLVGPKLYAGIAIPPNAKELVIKDDTLYAVVQTASAVIQGASFDAQMPVAAVGLDLGNRIVVTPELLQQAKLAWERDRHPAAEPGPEGG